MTRTDVTRPDPIALSPDRAAFIGELDRTHRYVLALHYGEGLTTAEIALVLQESEAAVDRALVRLRDLARSTLGVVAA